MNDYQASRSLPAMEGWFWLRVSVRAFRTQPFGMLSAAMLYMLCMTLLSMIPWFGILAAGFFMPFGTVFLAQSTQRSLVREPPSWSVFPALWRNEPMRRGLLSVGLVFAFFLLFAGAMQQWFGREFLAGLDALQASGADKADWDAVIGLIPWGIVFGMLAVYVPGLMMTWFAPLLVVNKGMPCGKALFYSFFGCVRNLLPIFSLGLVLLVAAALAGYVCVQIGQILGTPSLGQFLLGPVAVVISTIAYGTYWPMFHSLFEGVSEGEAPSESAES